MMLFVPDSGAHGKLEKALTRFPHLLSFSPGSLSSCKKSQGKVVFYGALAKSRCPITRWVFLVISQDISGLQK